MTKERYKRDIQYYKFCLYGFFKNLRFFEAFILLFFLSKGLDYWQIGLVYTLREVTRNILEIPSGVIADSYGRRTSLALSFLLYVVSYLVFYFSASWGVIMAAMFFYAVGDALRSGTHKAMIYSYMHEKGWEQQKTAYYGITRSWSKMGSAICSIGGGIFIWYSQDYNSIFLFSVIPAFINILMIMSYPRYLERNKATDDNRKKDSAFSAIKNTFKRLWGQMGKLKFWYTTNLVSMHTGFYKTVKDYLQPILATVALSIPLLEDQSVTRREALWVGLIFFVIYLMSSFASRNAGRFARLINNPLKSLRLTMYAGLTAGLAGGALAWFGFEWISVILLVMIFVIENIRKPIGFANIADTSSEVTWASVLSLEGQISSLYAALLAPLLGVFADIYGPGFGLAVISLIALVFSLVTDTLQKKTPKNV
ncbi:MAG: MFS transporter [Bacteroidota bacterium]